MAAITKVLIVAVAVVRCAVVNVDLFPHSCYLLLCRCSVDSMSRVDVVWRVDGQFAGELSVVATDILPRLINRQSTPTVTDVTKEVVRIVELPTSLKPHLHDATCCQTDFTSGWTAGCIVYTNIQPVVKLVVQLAVQLYSRLDNRQLAASYKRTCNLLSNLFDNRLDVCLHDAAGYPTGCTTGLTTSCIVYMEY